MKTRALILFLIIGKVSFGQYYNDLSLLYSRSDISGTARSAGSGGAYGSVGADMGSLDINPAGLGLFRSTEFSITPGLRISSNQGNYDQSSTNASLPKLYLGQAGIEWTKILSEASKAHEISFNAQPRLRSITFAINYQADNFYARSQNFNALNTTSSMIDNYTNYLNASGTSAGSITETYVASLVGLIGQNTSGQYISNAPAPVYQAGNIETRGSRDKITLGFGGNFNDKLYFGLSLSVPFISYTSYTTMAETNAGDSVSAFQNYSLTSTQSETGVGITGNLGLIYRPVSWFRLGASYHLPTWYTMTESYSSQINYANFDTASYYTDAVPYPDLKYTFRSPMMGVFSASFFLKKIGFISVDYQLQNLGSSHFNFGSGNEALTQSTNDTIKSYYTIEHTIRVGAEVAYKILRIRAGYAISTLPYKSAVANNPALGFEGYTGAKQNITAGLGLRFDRFFIDFAYIYSFTKDVSYPLAVDPVYNNYNSSTLLLTLGWKLNQSKSRRARSNYNNNNTKTNTIPPADQQY